MSGFEPPISGPPDQHFNRAKLHPDSTNIFKKEKVLSKLLRTLSRINIIMRVVVDETTILMYI
ncbi:hypothetical protein TASCI_10523 [Tenacibaculum ascidiaceicola]